MRIAWLSAATLSCLVALVVFERVHTWREPPDRDMAGYAVIGHEMLRGRLLYTDLWERKPPLLYATFAAAERFVGYGFGELLTVNLAATLITLAAVAVAGAVRGWVGAAAAGTLWAFLGGDLRLQANQPNAELFVNACLTAGFAVLIWWPARPRLRWAATVAVGLLFAAASLYKHHALVACAAMLVGHTVRDRSTLGRAARESAVALAVSAVVWGVVVAHFALAGRLDDLLEVLVRQNLIYANGMVANLGTGLLPSVLFWGPLLRAVGPVVGLIAAAAIVAAVPRARIGRPPILGPQRRIWCCWFVATWLVISLPGQFLEHYFQLWLPPICIGGGWAAATLVGRGPPVRRGCGRLAVLVVLAIVGWRELSNYRLTADQWSAQAFQSTEYFDNDFAAQMALAQRIRGLLRPGETFWNLGSDNTLYFGSGVSPPTGLLYLEPLVVGPHTDRYWTRLMADLNRARPDLIVVSMPTVRILARSAPVLPWMRANYAIANTGDLGHPSYHLFVRRGTDLYRRLNRAATGPVAAPSDDRSAPLTGHRKQ
jgi:hypothetical protein